MTHDQILVFDAGSTHSSSCADFCAATSTVASASGNKSSTSAYCASHKNWIRNIRFSIMNRPQSQ